MSQAIFNQIVSQLEMLEVLELQELERTIQKYLAEKGQGVRGNVVHKFEDKKELFREWDRISDQEAAMLKADFAEEDVAYSEAVLGDYFYRLQQEDVV